MQVRFVSGYAFRHTVSAVLWIRLQALFFVIRYSPQAARVYCRVPHPPFRALCEKRVGILIMKEQA